MEVEGLFMEVASNEAAQFGPRLGHHAGSSQHHASADLGLQLGKAVPKAIV